jgi:hypothetical protein
MIAPTRSRVERLAQVNIDQQDRGRYAYRTSSRGSRDFQRSHEKRAGLALQFFFRSPQ